MPIGNLATGDFIDETWVDSVTTAINNRQSGSFSMTFTASHTTPAVTVTFPTAFSAAPSVMLTAVAITGNTPVAVNLTGAPTTTGFQAIARVVPSTAFVNPTSTITVYWLAELIT